MMMIYTFIYKHIIYICTFNQIVRTLSGLLISLMLLLLSCISCVVLAGAARIEFAASVSITSGSDFTGNDAEEAGGMYGCDEDW